MISLSFGFDSVRYPDRMGDEIRQCLNEGIMVFASASNDGGEGSRTYPAKYPRVVCVHSATWQGKVSDFNPGPEGHDNFTVVGEKVRPTWRSKPTTEPGITRYKSGTSYATPVAVAVAAFMIGYIRKQWPDYPWVTKPWSPEGITRIFQLMSKRIDGHDWISPTRYIKHTRLEKIEGDLKQYLG
jgi:subtilisin family serine protease